MPPDPSKIPLVLGPYKENGVGICSDGEPRGGVVAAPSEGEGPADSEGQGVLVLDFYGFVMQYAIGFFVAAAGAVGLS